MVEPKNFLILAIMMGVIGIIIGSVSLWLTTTNLLQP